MSQPESATPKRICIIGDIHWEHKALLTNASFHRLDHDVQCNTKIISYAGGTAANFARACRPYFSEVIVCGTIGTDLAGRQVRQDLEDGDIELIAESVDDASTGQLVYLRDSSPIIQSGVRLLVVDKGANGHLSPNFIDEVRDKIQCCDILHVDGYTFLDEPRRAAVRRAINYANDAGVFVTLDLVPHDIHNYLSFPAVSKFIQMADYIISSSRTIAAYKDVSEYDHAQGLSEAIESWNFLQLHFPRLGAFIQYGLYDVEFTLLCTPGSPPSVRANGVTLETNLGGFGDRLASKDVANIGT